jgi:hypothetical protein
MEINILRAESDLLGFPVIKLSEWESVQDIIEHEPTIPGNYQSAYVYCQLNATDLKSIHYLENSGYHFSEFRVHRSIFTKHRNLFARSLNLQGFL